MQQTEAAARNKWRTELWLVNTFGSCPNTSPPLGGKSQHQNKLPLVPRRFQVWVKDKLTNWRSLSAPIPNVLHFSISLITWYWIYFLSSYRDSVWRLFQYMFSVCFYTINGWQTRTVWCDIVCLHKFDINMNRWRVIFLCVTLSWSQQTATTQTHEGKMIDIRTRSLSCFHCNYLFYSTTLWSINLKLVNDFSGRYL